MGIDELQREYDRTNAAINELTAAVADAESAATEAKSELAELTDGAAVLTAMAEEKAAMNRAAITRRSLVAAQHKRKDVQRQLDKARDMAVIGLIKETMNGAGDAIVDAYRAVTAARDEIYQAQRATGAYPVNSPLDTVCSGLETALAAVGGQVLGDTSRSVQVRYGDFTYIRRPIGYVPPKAIKARERSPILSAMQESIARLNQYNRQHAHEFSRED